MMHKNAMQERSLHIFGRSTLFQDVPGGEIAHKHAPVQGIGNCEAEDLLGEQHPETVV